MGQPFLDVVVVDERVVDVRAEIFELLDKVDESPIIKDDRRDVPIRVLVLRARTKESDRLRSLFRCADVLFETPTRKMRPDNLSADHKVRARAEYKGRVIGVEVERQLKDFAAFFELTAKFEYVVLLGVKSRLLPLLHVEREHKGVNEDVEGRWTKSPPWTTPIVFAIISVSSPIVTEILTLEWRAMIS